MDSRCEIRHNGFLRRRLFSRMNVPVRDVGLSAVFVFVAGVVLWPPRTVYWTDIAGEPGGGPTLALVGTVAVVLGMAYQYLTDVGPVGYVAGSVVAYVVGMGAIALVLAADSPVHLAWYALLTICLFVGFSSVLVYRHGELDLSPVTAA